MDSPLSISTIALLPDLVNPQKRRHKMNQFVSGALESKSSLRSSQVEGSIYKKKIKTEVQTQDSQDSIRLPSIRTLELAKPEIIGLSKNTSFIKKKLIQIQNSSITRLNKICRTQTSPTETSRLKTSKSRQKLCKSVLKKISCELSSHKQLKKSSLYTQGCEVIHAKFSFFDDQILSISLDRDLTNSKIRQSLEAYTKIENERILRLVQRQKELQEKYSALKVNLQKKMEKNASKKLSKKDFFIYSKNLQSHCPNSIDFTVPKTKITKR